MPANFLVKIDQMHVAASIPVAKDVNRKVRIDCRQNTNDATSAGWCARHLLGYADHALRILTKIPGLTANEGRTAILLIDGKNIDLPIRSGSI